MIFNTSAAYKVGDTVQIISKQEVDRLPRDQWGNPVLYKDPMNPFINIDVYDKTDYDLYDCVAVITDITPPGLCELRPVDPDSADPRFSWGGWLFSPNEFHPYTTSVISTSALSFDDLLKGAAPQ